MLTQEIKISLHNSCSKIIDEKLKNLNNILFEAQNAANNETKSSAGDKHETGRAMAQLETEKLTAQLSELSKLSLKFNQIDCSLTHNTVRLGALVKTNLGYFYITVSLGKIVLNTINYFVISSISPIGKQLIGLKKDDKLNFNGRNYIIEEII